MQNFFNDRKQTINTRVKFNKKQTQILKNYFDINPKPSLEERQSLSKQLKTPENKIKIWFQNRRAQIKTEFELNNSNDKSNFKVMKNIKPGCNNLYEKKL